MLTRRRFLLLLPSAAALPRLQAQAFLGSSQKESSPPTFVYFGTDTDPHISRGIYLSRWDNSTGRLAPPALVAETPRPSFLALSPTAVAGHRRLYAVNELGNASATITSFLIDPASGALRQLNQVSAAAAGPAYISLDATGKAAFVADYAGSAIATYHVLPSGELSAPVQRLDYHDPRFGHRGPNTARQDAPHPHSVHLSPDNRFLLVNDLGSDEISVFTVDPATARLGPPALFSNGRPGSGPRHIAFHPNGRWVYSINELDSTIDQFLWSETASHAAGRLTRTGRFVKTIAPDFAGTNTAAEVAVSPDGRFLYASNRGENSLVVFAIAPADGALSFIQRIPCGGKTPRQFALSPDAQWLVCGNQESATVTVFRRQSGTGHLAGPTQTLPLDSVMFAMFA